MLNSGRIDLSLNRKAAVYDTVRKWAPPLLAMGLTLAIFLRTLAPTVFPLDSAEMVTAAVTLGLVHGPGYPVYLLIAHLFSRLPVANPAYGVNLLSAVATMGTVGVLVLLLQQMTRRALPVMVAGLAFAFSFYVWSLSLVAEVYTFQILLLILMLFALWRWRETGSRPALVMAAFLLGLAAANNPATVLWWPGLLYLAWLRGRRQIWDRFLVLKTATALALGIAFLLYLPLRAVAEPAFVYVGRFDQGAVFYPLDLTRPGNLLWYISGQQFAGMVAGYSLTGLARESVTFVHRLAAAFMGIGLPLGAWGIWHLWRSRRRLALGLLLLALPHALFFIAYRTADKETMFLPVYLIWALFLGVGLQQLLRYLSTALAPIVMLLPLSLLLVNFSYADVSDFYQPHDVSLKRLKEAESNAIYLARWGDAAAMSYQQIVNGERADVTVVNAFFTTPMTQRAIVKKALMNGRPVYSSSRDAFLGARFRFLPVTHGYRLEAWEN